MINKKEIKIMETKITTERLLKKIREQKTGRTYFNKDNFDMHGGYLTYAVYQHDLSDIKLKEYGRNSIVIARYKYGQGGATCKRKDIVNELIENWTVEGLIQALIENPDKSPIELASEKNPTWWQCLEIMQKAKINCEYLKNHGITYDEYIEKKKAEWAKQKAEKEVA
jgi:hypothetical protein